MKRKFTLWAVGILFSVASLTAQTISDNVVNAFRNGDVSLLNACMEQQSELVFNDTPLAQSKEKLLQEMRRFFEQEKVTDFKVNHQGVRAESGFLIGTMQTDKGAYRVQCFLNKENNTLLIHQIRIDGTSK